MPNALATETSPYLQQHAHNPVHWLPWGDAALSLARSSGKPILLSIGYAACHWCHVMAHESFEDPATAALMNELYVNIKVDREERPDLDRLYQLAQQMLTGRGGGWPLTMFLLPEDQRPFFGGTYFPPAARHGLPAFSDLLTHVAHYFHAHRAELQRPAAAVVAALDEVAQQGTPGSAALSSAPLASCRAFLQQAFEPEHGGFGAAPKFPHPPYLARLLRDWHASSDQAAPDLQALYLCSFTLTRMAEGGLYDQLGGGFYRYSVDERWEIPHFEKMLYDNAQLLAVYAEAAAATGEPLFREIAIRTADWLLAEMRAPGGAFYSSLDADSEGHEGRYYAWQREELRAVLSADEYAVLARHYGVDGPPNFEGQWHFRVAAPLASDAESRLLASARARLLQQRAVRVRPGCDTKILTSWNALTIRALALAARLLERPDYGAAAAQALDWLRAQHWRDGRLLATSNGGAARLGAYLDDYAFLADAVLELLQWRYDSGALAFGCELLEVLLARFSAGERGGFYFTADDHEQLISRPRSFSDEALPAGNGVAAIALQRYGWLLAEPRWLAAAEAALRAAWQALDQHSAQHATLLQALDEQLQPPAIVVLRGAAPALVEWQRQLGAAYAPRRLTFAIAADASGLPAALAEKIAPASGAVAYVCRGTTCEGPYTSLPSLAAFRAGIGHAGTPAALLLREERDFR
jgi:uncharacterized protein YyaL (SSP411 family)